MTRGRTANTAHLVATDPAEAREQWLAVFARDRADLGPAHAAGQAAAEAARYAPPRRLDDVVAELHTAWTSHQACLDRLELEHLHRGMLSAALTRQTGDIQRLAALEDSCRQTANDAADVQQRADYIGALVAAEANGTRQALLNRWDAQRATARQAARVVLDGPGRLGLRRAAVARATAQLTDWATTWAPHLPDLPTDWHRLAQAAARPDDRSALWAALDASTRRLAEAAHPEHAALTAAAHAARQTDHSARRDLAEARRYLDAHYGSPAQTAAYAQQLADTERTLAGIAQELTDIRTRIAILQADPAMLAQPPDRLQKESEAWRAARRDAERRAARTAAGPTTGADGSSRRPRPEDLQYLSPHRAAGRGISR